MRIIAFDVAAKRIGTLDADGDDGVPVDGVNVPTVGLAAGAATVTGVSVPPATGLAAGAATVTGVSGNVIGPELEPLRIYPWEMSADNDYRPVHSLGNTVHRWYSVVTSPETSYDFSEIAEQQTANWGSTEYYRTGGVSVCSLWAGRDWYSVGADYDPVADGGPEAPQADAWTNDPAPPEGDPQTITVWTAARQLAALTVTLSIGETFPAAVGIGVHTPVDTEESYGALYNPWNERFISHYQQQFVGRLPAADDVPSGYDLLAVAGGYAGSNIWQYTWGSYMLRVREEREPHHPLSADGKTWVIDTGTAKQLAAIEYRDGWLHQNGIGPVVLPTDPRYVDTDWWAAQRISAIEMGILKPDVTSPVTVSSWARRTA